MATNELLPFANGEDANVLPTAQWQALTDILENGFQSGIARSEQVNRVLSQGAVASYVLGQLIVDQLNKDATLNKDTLYQNLVSALQENSKDVCLPLSGGNVTGNLTVLGKNVVRSVNGTTADASGNVAISIPNVYVIETWKSGNNWYRKWSDGFIEQGGRFTSDSGDGFKTITLHTPFTTSDYVAMVSKVRNYFSASSTSHEYVMATVGAIGGSDSYTSYSTTSTFMTYMYANAVAYWYACGY